jgi:hypothetical protein
MFADGEFSCCVVVHLIVAYDVVTDYVGFPVLTRCLIVNQALDNKD